MSVSIVFARSLSAEFTIRGLDAARLLSRSGLSQTRLLDGGALLSYDEAARLASCAVAMSGDASIGHTAGLRTPPTALPLLSSVLLAQRTLRDAATCFERYVRLITEGPVYTLREQGGVATWSFVPAVRPNQDTQVMADFAIAVTTKIAGSMIGVAARHGAGLLQAVHFQHEEPLYSDVYRSSYQCPIVFGSAYNGLLFACEVLDRPVMHADAGVVELLRVPLEQRLREAALGRSWVDRTRFVLEHKTDFTGVDGQEVARVLQCSERTLRRHLEHEGSSLGALLDERRSHIACRSLLQTKTPIGQLSRSLGFSSASTFSRAFRSWTGQTPADYRRRRRERVSDGVEKRRTR